MKRTYVPFDAWAMPVDVAVYELDLSTATLYGHTRSGIFGVSGSVTYLNETFDYFKQPPQYMTSSNDVAELLSVVPAKFNRLVFYNGEEPHSGHITHPELLTDDLSAGRLSFNFFADVRPTN